MHQPRKLAIKQQLANTRAKWSPHAPDIIAVSSSENFGVVGKSITQIKKIDGNVMQNIAMLNEKDAIFGLSWFELHDKFLLLGSGSGEIIFWEIGKGKAWQTPIQGEINSVQCAFKNPLFIAGSTGGMIHLGNCDNGKIQFTLPAHIKNCTQVKWHPTSDKVFASAGSDGLLKMWDHSLPKPNISSHQAHNSQILSIDFNKYQEQIVTASIDKSIRVWDLRNLTAPINVLQHHRYPPRTVCFSPHAPWLLGSGSYDMNVHFYDLRDQTEPLKMKGSSHSQFVTSVDFNMYEEKTVLSSGWDGRLLVWEWDQPQPMIM